MKITTSCSGRFHIYDQALQLYRHGVLHRFINDYPKWMTRRWGLPDSKVSALLLNGIVGRMTRYTSRYLSETGQNRFLGWTHSFFSRRLATYLPEDTDVFIGLSSFCLEALRKAKETGIHAVVDHGSLHQETERSLLHEESELWNFPMHGLLPPQWIIDKENAEFEVADRVFVLSRVAMESLVEQKINEKKIFVNHCGVDIARFQRNEKRDDVFRVIQCGTIHPRKGAHYLIKAFRDIRLNNSELWFVGGGIESSVLRPFIEKHHADNIRFIGAVPQDRLPEVYSQGSVFVLASVADGFGMVVPQAMACGLPVIVTENVGAADLIQDGVNGFVIPIRDVEVLKDRLLRLYEDSTLQQQMGQSAYNSVRSGHTWDDYGDRLVAYLQSFDRQTR